MIPGIVWPGGYQHDVTNNYYVDYAENVNNYSGISSSKYNSGLAQLLAADAIHCTTSTKRHQMGIGGGYSEGKNGFAVGYCNTFRVTNDSTHMLGVKAMGANDVKPRYNLGYNWTF